jgi:hypothetical protein
MFFKKFSMVGLVFVVSMASSNMLLALDSESEEPVAEQTLNNKLYEFCSTHSFELAKLASAGAFAGAAYLDGYDVGKVAVCGIGGYVLCKNFERAYKFCQRQNARAAKARRNKNKS